MSPTDGKGLKGVFKSLKGIFVSFNSNGSVVMKVVKEKKKRGFAQQVICNAISFMPPIDSTCTFVIGLTLSVWGGYTVNMCDFYFYKVIGKLTVSL